MPIYEYECPQCGVVEVFQGINDDPLSRCPKCKRRKIKKLISNSTFHLKGSGWYATDYAGKKSAPAGGNGGGNGGGDKTGTKPEKSETAKTGASDKKDQPAKNEASTSSS